MMTGIMGLLMGAAMAADEPSGNSAPTDPKKQFEEAKAYWDAVKAAEDAKKAAHEAQAAALKAAVPGQTGIGGDVELGTEPAKPEAMLLTVQAADEAAAVIAGKIGGQLNASKSLLVVTSTDELSLANLNFYELQRTQLDGQLIAAAKRLDEATKAPDESRTRQHFTIPPVAAIGGAIEIASKLGSYFLSDYKFGKVEVALPDRTISYAAAAQLQPHLAKGGQIFIPEHLAAAEAEKLIGELGDASEHYLDLLVSAEGARASEEPAVKLAVASADAVGRAWEAFVTSLTTVPQGGQPAIEDILRQKAVRKHLDNKTPVLVLDQQIAGSYYTKKNLWTFLGGPPLYAAGAVVVSYVLLDGKDRHVMASGSVPIHGGYDSIRSVTKRFRPPFHQSSSNAPTNSSSPATPSSPRSSAR